MRQPRFLEKKCTRTRRILGTVPLVLQCLSNCRLVMMHSNPDLAPDEQKLREVLGLEKEGSASSFPIPPAEEVPLLLFPSPGADFLEVCLYDMFTIMFLTSGWVKLPSLRSFLPVPFFVNATTARPTVVAHVYHWCRATTVRCLSPFSFCYVLSGVVLVLTLFEGPNPY